MLALWSQQPEAQILSEAPGKTRDLGGAKVSGLHRGAGPLVSPANSVQALRPAQLSAQRPLGRCHAAPPGSSRTCWSCYGALDSPGRNSVSLVLRAPAVPAWTPGPARPALGPGPAAVQPSDSAWCPADPFSGVASWTLSYLGSLVLNFPVDLSLVRHQGVLQPSRSSRTLLDSQQLPAPH